MKKYLITIFAIAFSTILLHSQEPDLANDARKMLNERKQQLDDMQRRFEMESNDEHHNAGKKEKAKLNEILNLMNNQKKLISNIESTINTITHEKFRQFDQQFMLTEGKLQILTLEYDLERETTKLTMIKNEQEDNAAKSEIQKIINEITKAHKEKIEIQKKMLEQRKLIFQKDVKLDQLRLKMEKYFEKE